MSDSSLIMMSHFKALSWQREVDELNGIKKDMGKEIRDVYLLGIPVYPLSREVQWRARGE